MAGAIEAERHGDVALLRIVNPDKRNALDHAICRALADAVTGLSAAGARAAVLTGAGDKAFCSGFDLDALSVPGAQAAFDGLIDAVAAQPVPMVAALNGATYGGGCELAATCDLRVAHAGVKLAIPAAKLGIVYPPRGLARFSALCGESRARQLFLTARTVDAAEAASWGLVDQVVAADAVVARALELATVIAGLVPAAVQGMRRSFEDLLRRRTT